jgi:hypothetical protein
MYLVFMEARIRADICPGLHKKFSKFSALVYFLHKATIKRTFENLLASHSPSPYVCKSWSTRPSATVAYRGKQKVTGGKKEKGEKNLNK